MSGPPPEQPLVDWLWRRPWGRAWLRFLLRIADRVQRK